MPEIATILCAIDLSEVSGQVAAYAALLARQSDASVLVLYVAPALNQYSDTEMPLEVIKKFIAERMERASKDIPGIMAAHFAGLDAQSRVVAGYPPDAILDIARAEDIDLIVMGTHGRRGVHAAVFGSVAEKVIKQAPRAVLVVRPQ